MYMKTNSKEFNDFVKHIDGLASQGYEDLFDTMLIVAEEGLWKLHDEASRRTQEHTGKLLDSFVLGNKQNVYDVGKDNVVFGSALYYAQMVNNGHAIVPPGYKRDYRRQKRRKKENQRYDYYEGAHFFNPALDKISEDFEKTMSDEFDLIVQDTSFTRKSRRRRRRKK